jgi:predicted transcriptional regulator of viral defense system
VTYRRTLRKIGLDQHGYVSTKDAAEADVPPVELRKLASRGGLAHIGRGLYRFDDIPTTPQDPFAQAVLWAGPDAVLAADAVLALHHLAQVNPQTLRVYTPHRVRRDKRNDITIIQKQLPAKDTTLYYGIPSTTVRRALIDCVGLVMASRLREAAEPARTEGLLTAIEWNTLADEAQMT